MGLLIVHLSIHGLVRGDRLELGCNADTGGQAKQFSEQLDLCSDTVCRRCSQVEFVVELARHTATRQEVGEVVILTRQIVDDNYSVEYASAVSASCARVRS